MLSETDVDLFYEYARYFRIVSQKHWAWNGATNPVDFDTDDLSVYEPILEANVRLELELKELLFHGLNIHLSMRNVGRYNKELGKVYRRFRGYLDNIQEWYRDMKGFNEFEMERIKALKEGYAEGWRLP